MKRIHCLILLTSTVLVALSPAAEAGRGRRGGHRGGCGSGCGECGGCEVADCGPTYQTVERTVMVPQMFTENRTINVVQCRTEERERQYTVMRPVNETRTVEYQYTVNKFETRTRDINYTVRKPVMSTEQRQYTVMVPEQQTREATRRVCRMVPVQQTRTVCEDQGSWQEVPQTYTSGCGDCAQTYTCMRRCWVPKYVTREVAYTVMRPQIEEVPYTYTVTVCRPEMRTKDVQVCNFVSEQRTRQVQYRVCVPEQLTGTREVTTCRMVPEQKTATYTVQVPETVQKEVQVQVCRMVPKTITCQVPVRECCASTGNRDESTIAVKSPSTVSLVSLDDGGIRARRGWFRRR
jgi:hypothetical protein